MIIWEAVDLHATLVAMGITPTIEATAALREGLKLGFELGGKSDES